MPRSYGPETPLLPPNNEIPTVLMRSRNMVIWCWTSSPAFVRMKLSKGICHWCHGTGTCQHDVRKGVSKTNKDVLPTAVVPLEIQTVLPKVGRDRAVRLQVDIVRIPRSRIATEAQSQREVLVVRHVVAYLSKQRRSGLEARVSRQSGHSDG